jgi:glucokinase
MDIAIPFTARASDTLKLHIMTEDRLSSKMNMNDTHHANRGLLCIITNDHVDLTNIKTLFADRSRDKHVKFASLELLDDL